MSNMLDGMYPEDVNDIIDYDVRCVNGTHARPTD